MSYTCIATLEYKLINLCEEILLLYNQCYVPPAIEPKNTNISVGNIHHAW